MSQARTYNTESIIIALEKNHADLISIDLCDIDIEDRYRYDEWFTELEDVFFGNLANALNKNNRLQHFGISDLSSLDLNIKCAERAIKALSLSLANHTSLTSLRLDFALNDIKNEIKYSLLESIQNPRLTDLVVRLQYDDHQTLAKIGEYLRMNQDLKSIHIYGGCVGLQHDVEVQDSWGRFLSGLKGKKLKNLEFQLVQFGDLGYEMLVETLNSMDTLERIELCGNGITDNGFSNNLILTNIKNLKIKAFHYVSNDLAYMSLASLPEVLKKQVGLKELNLNGSIHNDDCFEIMLKEIIRLEILLNHLSFDEIKITKRSINYINNFLMSARTVKSLNLRISVVDSNIEALKESLLATRIQTINFGASTSDYLPGEYSMFIDAVNKNKYLRNIIVPNPTNGLIDANLHSEKQYKESQQSFVDVAITFIQCFFSAKNPPDWNQPIHLGNLPLELIVLITMMAGDSVLGMNESDVRECTNQILKNFHNREQSTLLPRIGWWSKRNSQNKEIFKEIENVPAPSSSWCCIL